ncbi:uncharacterized protein LOC141914192 [Tubulanus polymorphus]|uniref:uncharacterized protein LOC141914192 n=1 Tax=Tubulanus polymorphus TaxID=672921 RepID=UPI003DA4487F
MTLEMDLEKEEEVKDCNDDPTICNTPLSCVRVRGKYTCGFRPGENICSTQFTNCKPPSICVLINHDPYRALCQAPVVEKGPVSIIIEDGDDGEIMHFQIHSPNGSESCENNESICPSPLSCVQDVNGNYSCDLKEGEDMCKLGYTECEPPHVCKLIDDDPLKAVCEPGDVDLDTQSDLPTSDDYCNGKDVCPPHYQCEPADPFHSNCSMTWTPTGKTLLLVRWMEDAILQKKIGRDAFVAERFAQLFGDDNADSDDVPTSTNGNDIASKLESEAVRDK